MHFHQSTALMCAALFCLALVPVASAEPGAPPPPPAVAVGPGYYAILPDKLLLAAKINAPMDAAKAKLTWSKTSGPGEVAIEKPGQAITWATAKVPGKYVFTLKGTDGATNGEASVTMNVYPAGAGFGNPLLPGMFPDPHVMFDEGKFYIYATSMENDKGSYGRASVWVSRDFVNWDMKNIDGPVHFLKGTKWLPDGGCMTKKS